MHSNDSRHDSAAIVSKVNFETMYRKIVVKNHPTYSILICRDYSSTAYSSICF